MSTFHFLNVKQGACQIIQHNGGRVSMIDICNGNASRKSKIQRELEAMFEARAATLGNFGMKDTPTHPLDYLQELGVTDIWRFILSHPDMDHMDGLDELFKTLNVVNYWDSGARKKEVPSFDGDFARWNSEDWNRYAAILNGKVGGLTVLKKHHGDRFPFANAPDKEHDGLYILAPNQTLIDEASSKCNRASYMILYRSTGGKILIPGDAENSTWKFVMENYEDDVKNCAILLAPHHGRKSDLDFSFLKTVNPQLVLLGNADSEHLAYDAYRNYPAITNNQAGNVVAECHSSGIDIYVENEKYAEKINPNSRAKNNQGYPLAMQILPAIGLTTVN